MKKFLVTFFIIFFSFGLISPKTIHADDAEAARALAEMKLQQTKPNASQAELNAAGDSAANAAKAQEATIAKNLGADKITPKACSSASDIINPDCWMRVVYRTVDTVGNAILGVFALILAACGSLFNYSIVYLVVHMKERLSDVKVIYDVWKTTRDLANMFFIFILLTIAIQTIIDVGGNYKKLLTNVVLVALFINFSFFFTGLLIDFSNMTALQFYNGFKSSSCGDANGNGCVSQTVVDALKIGSIYDTKAAVSGNGAVTPATSESGFLQYVVTVIMGSILMVVIAGVFLASAILIIYRFIELIMLLMLSPLAFAMWILPSTKKYHGEWWSRLSDQLIFAPAYFMFLWVAMKIISSKTLFPDGNNFQAAFNGKDTMTLMTLMSSYIIAISLFSYSLILAKKLGAKGTDMATSASKGLQGIIGRNTVGRASSRIANSKLMQRAVAFSPMVGGLAQRSFDYGAKASFGGKKGGFEQAQKDSIKHAEEQAKRFGPNSTDIEKANEVRNTTNKDLELKLKNVETAANAKHADAETKVNADITSAENDLKAAETKAKDRYLSPDEKIEAEEAVAEKKKLLEEANNKKTALAKQKEAEIAAERKLHVEQSLEAHRKADKVLGVDKKEAERRAKLTGKEGKDLEEFVAEEMKNEGFKKAMQNKFLKSKDARYLSGYARKIPVIGGIIGGTIDYATMRRTRVSEMAAIRKNVIKEKTYEEQIAELVKKAEKEKKDKEDSESKGEKKPEKEGSGEAKP